MNLLIITYILSEIINSIKLIKYGKMGRLSHFASVKK